MIQMYKIAGTATGYWGNYFNRSVKQKGGLETAKRMLAKKINKPSEQKGFQALINAGRVDLSLESLVLQPRFAPLFTEEELSEAKRRLGLLPPYTKRVSVPAGDIYAEELDPTLGFQVKAKKQITVNAYERDPKAREVCLKRYGYSCKVCDFKFEETYGEIGKEFIHVHHKKPLAGLQEGYSINPIHDLVPVCPICHAMLHSSNPPLGIDELKMRLIKR